MKTIHKFTINVGENLIEMSSLVRPLTVQMQNGRITLWCLVDDEYPPMIEVVRVFGTGHEVKAESDLEYIGTVQDGRFVWHAFLEK